MRVDERGAGERREVQVYLPARYRASRRYPLLIVHDGADYLHFSALKTVLDNLIHRLEVAPMIVALTQSRQRLRDYAARLRHSRFLAEELVPALEARYPLLEGRGRAAGSWARASAAWRRSPRRGATPGQFGRLLLQSGSFAFTDIGPSRRGPAFEPVVEFVNAFRDAPVARRRARLPLLRRLRVPDLREPVAGADPPVDRHGRALRRVVRRPQLGELARPPARRASPSSSPARSGWSTSRHGQRHANDWTVPRALTSAGRFRLRGDLKRLDLAIPWDGDSSVFDVRSRRPLSPSIWRSR